MAQRTLWSELPPDVKELLLQRLDEWHIKALMYAKCGHVCYISKLGQLPRYEQRMQARAMFASMRADGIPYRKTVATICDTLQVSKRSVERWISRNRQTD